MMSELRATKPRLGSQPREQNFGEKKMFFIECKKDKKKHFIKKYYFPENYPEEVYSALKRGEQQQNVCRG